MPKIATSDIDAVKRRLLTPQNLVELNITPETVQTILASDPLKLNAQKDGRTVTVSPDGLSINETVFGNYSGPTASDLGYNAYFHIGAPLVEERADIIQPPPDVLSSRLFENRSSLLPRTFTDNVQFSITNTLNWSLEGTSQLTLDGSITGTLSQMLQRSLAESIASMSSTTVSARLENDFIVHNHKDNVGTQEDTDAEAAIAVTAEMTVTDTETDTESNTATGSGTARAALMLGITGSVGGSVTTSWSSTSTVSGDIPANSSIQTLATQRRQVRQYTYELPITFGGFVALHYPEPVSVQKNPPQSTPPNTNNVIAQDIASLKLAGDSYRPKGIAELVSTLGVEHIIFDEEGIANRDQSFSYQRPHYFPANRP